MVSVCFVCLGNICRSPTAEGVMRELVHQQDQQHQQHQQHQRGADAWISIDSAGTGAWHAGEPADSRARATAEARGLRLDSIARQVTVEDFTRFDYIVAMDQDNQNVLLDMAPDEQARARVFLLRSFDPNAPQGAEVPDPYYGGPGGFDEVFDICEAACRGLLAHIRANHELPAISSEA